VEVGEIVAASAFLVAWVAPLLYSRLVGTLLVGLLFELLTSGAVALIAGSLWLQGRNALIRRVSVALLVASAVGSILTLSLGLHYGPIAIAVTLLVFLARLYGRSRKRGPAESERWAKLAIFGFVGLFGLVLVAVISPLPLPLGGCTPDVLPLLGLGAGKGVVQTHPERFLAVGLCYHLYVVGLHAILLPKLLP
jgi:hypothetical protein